MKIKFKEGYIRTKRGKVYYKKVGDKGIPLIILHGGPGGTHYPLKPLEDLANERTIIFYDQIGCGNSDRLLEKKLWKVKTFIEELSQVIRELELKEYHILGKSWGAALGASFALRAPKGLKGLILADPYLSTPVWMKDAKRLIKKLPLKMQKALNEGDIHSEEFKRASKEYYQRYVSGRKKKPKVIKEMNLLFGSEVYLGMWGPKEFKATGTLKNFDLTKKLKNIQRPVLLLCGRYDEATPEATKYFKNLFPNAQMRVFEKSAHDPYLTERKEFMKTVQTFLLESE